MAQDNGWLERLKPYLSGGEDESGATQTVTDGVPSWKQRLSAFMAEKEVQTSAPTESEALRNHASTDITFRNRLRDAEAAEKQAGAAYREVMRSGDEQARKEAGAAVTAANAERRSAQEAYDASKVASYIAQKNAQYASVRENSDFRTRSEPDANVMRLGQTGQDAAAALYWQINSRGQTKYKNQPSNYITDEEARTFNYLYNTRSEKDAMAYYDYIERDLNSRRETATLGKYQTLAEKKPAAASALSVGANLISGVGIADAGLQMLENRIQGDPRGVDYSSGGMLPGKITSTIRETRAKNIAENHPFEIAGTNVASFLYQTGMSMADSAVVLGLSAIGAPAAVTLLGGSAATQAALEVKARGGGDGQALAYGIAAGINEMLFEKISLEALLKPAERGFAKGIRNVLKQAFTEGSEEVNTSVANALADYAISLYTNGGQTAIQNRAAQLRAQYQLSEADAMKASMNEWMGGLVTDFLGGFISGGVMGGAKVAGTNVVGATQDARIAALKTRIENAAQNPAPVQNAEPRTGAAQETISPAVQNTQEQTEVPDVRDTGAATESERTIMEAPETEEKAGEGIRNAAPAVSENRLTNAERSAMISENAEGEMQDERTEAAEPAAAERTAAEHERGGQDTDRSTERGTGLADSGAVQTVSGAKRFLQNYVEQRNYRKQRSSARELSAAAETAGLRQVSAREMGVEGGTDTKQNAVLTRDLLTPAMRRRQAEFAARGIQVDYVIGLVETQETGKDAVQVRGAVSSDGKHIWVTANHPNLSWAKILDHEEFHTIRRQDAGIIDRTMQQMREDPKVSGHLDETLRRYEELYQPFGVEGDEVIEEMLADYYAGYDATRLLDTDRKTAKAVRSAVEGTRTKSAQNGQTRTEADSSGQERTEADTGQRFSREMKWKPRLSNAEWELANSAIQYYDGDDFDESKRYALKSAKGSTVFVVYSKSEDATLLYAISGEKAALAYEVISEMKAGEKRGDGNDNIAKSLGSGIEVPGNSSGNRASGDALPRNGSAAERIGTVASGQSGTQTKRRRSGQKGFGDSEYRALRNALTDSRSYRGSYSRNLPGETAGEEDTRRLTKSIEFQPEAVQPYTGGLSAERRSGASGEVPSGRKISRVRSNALTAFFNDVEANMDGMRKEDYPYDPVSEKESIATAKQRIAEDFDGWAERLAEDDRQWDGKDVDTAMGILYNYRQDARMTGDYRKVISFSHVIQKHGTRGGEEIQAFAKYSRTATCQTQKAAEKLYNENKLNPAQQKRLNAYMEAIDSVIENDSGDAAKAVTDRIEAGAKSGDSRRTDDAMNVIREIYENVRVQRDHGEPVENWIELTGEKLAQELSGRMKPPKSRTKTTMQTILGDMIRFMDEHAVPKRSASANARTATARIADYINNRDAYAEVWATAQRYLRAQYADDPAAMDALEAFLTGTISYNADAQHFDRTMYDAILETSDGIGLDVQKIRGLAAVGLSTQTVERIADEFVRNIRDLTGEDTDRQWEPMLRDAVTRHIRDVMMTQTEQGKRLGGMIDKTAKELNMKLGEILTQSKGDKRIAAAQLTNWLVSELGVRSSDAAIAAKTVTDAFMAELAERSDRRLQQMFRESEETQLGKKERNRLMELFRLGGFENQNVEDAVADALGIGNVSRAKQRQIVSWMASFADTLDSIYEGDTEALKALIREQAAIRNTKLSRTAEKVLEQEQDFRYLYDFAMSQLKLIAGDFNVRSLGSKVSTVQTISHLLNIRTAMRNLISNQVYDLVASAANNVAILPDIALGRVTGSRTVGLDKSWASREKRLGAAQGARRNYLEISLDVNPKGDNASKYGTKGRTTFAAANSRGLGRILNLEEKVLGYELNTTDEFHKGSVRGETRDSLRRYVERGDLTRQEMEDFAESEALSRSFQDDTAIGNLFSLLKNSLNTIGFGDSGRRLGRVKVKDFGLGDMILKYTQVPGALIHRAIEFSPIGYAKALYHIVQIRQAVNRGERATVPQRKAALAIGQATTGTGLILLFMALAKGGLLRRDDDEKDKNAKAAKNAQGLSGTQLNVSALIRAINGGKISIQDGDVLQDIGFLEPLDTLMTVATLLANEDELGLGDIPTDTLEGIWRALEDTSAMQTISSIINVVQYHDEENDLPLYAEIPIEIASSNISGFVSAPIRQLAQATDTVYRDQYRSQKAALQIGAKLANSVPGARQILAPKITPLGRDKTYQKPALNALNALVTAGNISVYRADKVVDELNRVYAATGDAKIWAERNAPYTVTVETGQGKEQLTLTPDERTAYQRSRGQLTERMISQTADAAWYKKLDAETQAEALNWIGNFANHMAKSEMLDGRGIDYSSRTYDKYAAMLGRKAYPEIVREAMSKSAGLIIAGVPTKDADRVSQMSSEDARSYLIDADMTDSEKLSAYGVLVGTETTTESGAPTQWAKLNTAVDDGVSVDDALRMAQEDTLGDYMKWRDSDAKKAGIESDTYIRYRTETAKLSADKGKDGKSISGSKKKKVVAYIHRLKLTAKQKDALYLDAGYTEKELGEAPWHRLSLPTE